MNKKEKLYFINKIFENHINYNDEPKKQYDKNWEIIHMFTYLELIPENLFNPLVELIKKGAYEDKYSNISDAQQMLCKEFKIPIKY